MVEWVTKEETSLSGLGTSVELETDLYKLKEEAGPEYVYLSAPHDRSVQLGNVTGIQD